MSHHTFFVLNFYQTAIAPPPTLKQLEWEIFSAAHISVKPFADGNHGDSPEHPLRYNINQRTDSIDMSLCGKESEVIELVLVLLQARERDACLEHWKVAAREEAGKSYPKRTWPHKIDRTVMAEKTGEPYTFEEILPAYTGYQPDLQSTDVDARTRGLAQLCLALFNLNEFAYLD